jgi:transcriptional regulator with XRE-family HTH domain
VAAGFPHRKALAQAIRQYRREAKLTQEQLAESAELSANFVGEIERMEKTVSVDALARIAAALNVRIRDLFKDA